MKKTYCDICEKEMNPSTVVILGGKYPKTEVIIHREGRTLDICDACCSKIIRYAFHDMRDSVAVVS